MTQENSTDLMREEKKRGAKKDAHPRRKLSKQWRLYSQQEYSFEGEYSTDLQCFVYTA